ncbi:GNAT family N-acetyltransferase [Candidatus Woesearchaeota archaeon]|nr:GNAT family N-acetyltransferase [Candidatus Woesearchaeota archaeon]
MIRIANIKDAGGIGNVLKESYNIESAEEGKEAFFEEMKKGIIYIAAEEKGKVIGITTLKFHGLPKHGLCELDRIAVLPEYRGKGVAESLFNALIGEAKKWFEKRNGKLRKLFILTHAENARAQKFYEKMGLKHEATLKDHYYNGKDEFVYSRFVKNHRSETGGMK